MEHFGQEDQEHGQDLQPYPSPPGWDQQRWQERVLDPEAVPGPDEQVRVWTTEQLRALIRNLTPYVDGTFGVVSTKHASILMSAVRELNKLWSAYYRIPPPPEPEVDLEAEAEAEREAEQVAVAELARITRSRVLDQLQELRSRSTS